jgi:DNA-directed RNA polymerase sigma subunit (sigma70/sigma32)
MALVDLDLRELELVARLLGEKHAIGVRALRTTLEEIAIACGVNRQKIHWIEKRALKKLRAGFAARGIMEIANG